MSLASVGVAAPKRLAIPAKASGTVQYGPPGSTFGGQQGSGGSLADVIAQARNLANQQVQAQVSAIQAQQHIATQQAAARAAEINQASRAAADYLQTTGLAGRLQSQDYQQALNNQTGLASGFSGQLAHDAAAQTAEAQQGIAGVAGNTQQLSNKGPALANVLYGLGGYIPGNALNVQGLGAVTAARGLPASTMGYGQQQAIAALQSGQGQAASLASQIAQAQAQGPSITSNLIGQFTNAYNQAQQQALNAASIQSLIGSRKTAGKVAIVNADTSRINAKTAATNAVTSQYRAQTAAAYQTQEATLRQQQIVADTKYKQGQLSLGQYNAQTSRINAQTERVRAAAAAAATRTISPKNIGGFAGWIDQNGQTHYATNPETGARIPYTTGSSSKSSGGLTANAYSNLVQKAQTAATDFYYGVQPDYRYDSKAKTWIVVPGTGKAAVYYPAARTQLLEMGPKTKAWRNTVDEILHSLYGEGEGGRPYSAGSKSAGAKAGAAVSAAGTAAAGFVGG